MREERCPLAHFNRLGSSPEPSPKGALSFRKARAQKLNLRIKLPTSPQSGRIHTAPRHSDDWQTHLNGVATEIVPNLFVGDSIIAHDEVQLNELGITHILNCVGSAIPNIFPRSFVYKNISLKDSPSEQIFCLFYDALDFLEEALCRGKILVHCRCGISRSTAITMAFLMYKHHYSYEKAFSVMTAVRPSCSPNAGFIIALQNWEAHLAGLGPNMARIYCIEKKSDSDSEYMASPVISLQKKAHSCYILHTPSQLFVWTGVSCTEQQVNEAHHLVHQLQKYESASHSVQYVQQDNEPLPFLERLHRITFS